MRYIKLTQNQRVIVDNEDFEYLNQFKWTYHSMGYAYRMIDRKSILMHRLILKTTHGQQVDHVNHNGLDNRRRNLRISTQRQNLQNASIRKDNKTGFKGVYFNKKRAYFQAYINSNSRHIYLGMAKTAKEAHLIYKKGAEHYFGEFANP